MTSRPRSGPGRARVLAARTALAVPRRPSARTTLVDPRSLSARTPLVDPRPRSARTPLVDPRPRSARTALVDPRPRSARTPLAARIAGAAITGLVGLAALGCGKSDRKPADGTGSAAPVLIDVAGVNALVPAALKDQLVFERRELPLVRGASKGSYTLAAPAGWVQISKMFAHLRPAGATGQSPRFEVGSNCDGPCTPRPWEVVADRVNFAPRMRGNIVKDDHSAGRRTMIAEVTTGGTRTTDVVVAWWTDGDKRYHVCTAILDDALKAAAPAFERACQAVASSGDD